MLQNVAAANAASNNPSKFQQCIAEGDLEFVSFQSKKLRVKMKSKEVIFSLKLLKNILLKMDFFTKLHSLN